jgi:hypothetical protein
MDIEKLENGIIACTNYTIQELISSEEELPCTASCLQQFQGNKQWQEIMSPAVILIISRKVSLFSPSSVLPDNTQWYCIVKAVFDVASLDDRQE